MQHLSWGNRAATIWASFSPLRLQRICCCSSRFSSLTCCIFCFCCCFLCCFCLLSATVKRRIYEQFASGSRALNVRHELTRHSPQEQEQEAAAGRGGREGSWAEQQEVGQQLQMISLTRWPPTPTALAFVLRLVIYFINNKMLSATRQGRGGGREERSSWLHAGQAMGYCVPAEGDTGTDVLRGAAACGGSKWQGLSVGLIVRKRR